MKSSYKRLGDYIQPVVGRNIGLENLPLVGLSITKKFIPSIANTIGTDMSTYRIIERNQFAYGPVTSRNGDKITIALFDDFDKALISQAYIPFEVIDETKLLPEYLMMWFRRPEFDRYARFKSHGSAREIFDWAEMCEVRLPIPSLAQQQKIVQEYQTVQNRIALNNQLIAKLEETAQTIYKQWFVDFEFPFVPSSEVETVPSSEVETVPSSEVELVPSSEVEMPYKSNGGKMVWCEELEKEIPEGWECVQLKDLVICNPETLSSKHNFKKILYLDTSNITNNKVDVLQELILELDEIPSRAKRKVKTNDIIYSTVRPTLKHYGIIKNLPDNLIVSTGFAVFRVKHDEFFPELIYSFLTHNKTINYLQAKAEMSVSTYPSITSDDILNLYFAKPDNLTLENAFAIFKTKDDFINLKNKENQKLGEIKEFLLSRMTRVN